MHYDDEQYDTDHENYEDGNTPLPSDQVAFLDYGNDGLWIVGIMNPHEQGDRRITEIIDEDSDINSLVKRAVYDWGVDPHELWVSPCAKEIATLTLTTGRRI
jgi:hypothetical protein